VKDNGAGCPGFRIEAVPKARGRALVAHQENDSWRVDVLGAPSVAKRSEKELISSFVDRIAELKPQLVTFNGSSFDLPVLRYRAMVNGVSAPGLASRAYFNRYTEDAVDLCDVLSSFSPQGKATLHEMSRVMSRPAYTAAKSRNFIVREGSAKSPTIARAMS
jgi:predicted PolB exonuclease-like 3'-5' exonuclease